MNEISNLDKKMRVLFGKCARGRKKVVFHLKLKKKAAVCFGCVFCMFVCECKCVKVARISRVEGRGSRHRGR